MNALLLRRLVMSVVPFVLMGAVVLMAIFGDHGLVRRHELLRKRAEVERHVHELERANAELERQIRLLDRHPVGVQRLVAEELLEAPAGSTIYRFQGADQR